MPGYNSGNIHCSPSVCPGWLSATLIAAVTGLFMLVIFKYTSNQRAVKQVRNQIKANVLALSLFKDSVPVSMRAQGRILVHAGHLMIERRPKR